MPENKGKQNPEDYYTKKYKKHITCSYSYKSVDYTFSKPFKTYLGKKNKIYSFINSVIEESKYCNEVMKNILAKNLQ